MAPSSRGPGINRMWRASKYGSAIAVLELPSIVSNVGQGRRWTQRGPMPFVTLGMPFVTSILDDQLNDGTQFRHGIALQRRNADHSRILRKRPDRWRGDEGR